MTDEGLRAQFVQCLKTTKLEEAPVEYKQFTSEPALLLISELPNNWVRNHTYLRWGVLSYKADDYNTGLSQTNTGYYMGRENELLRSIWVLSFSVHDIWYSSHLLMLIRMRTPGLRKLL